MPKRSYFPTSYEEFKRRHPGATFDDYWLSDRAFGESLERAERINRREWAAAGPARSPRYVTGRSVTTGDIIEMDVAHDLTADIEGESDEAIASAQYNMLSPGVKRTPAPASGRKTVKRHMTKGNMSGLDPVTVQTYSPLTVRMPSVGPTLRSAFAQFKQWFDGHRTLQNSFSFLVQSERGKRGTVLIPLRTDPVIYGDSVAKSTSNDNYYRFAAGADYDSTSTDPSDQLIGRKVQADNDQRHYCHVVGDLVRNGTNGSTICEPWTKTNEAATVYADHVASASNMIVPGMTQLHLEQSSWALNNMKVITQKSISGVNTANYNNYPIDNVRSLAVLGQWDVSRYDTDGKETTINNYVSRRYNGARQQNWVSSSKLRHDNHAQVPLEEQYEVQAGKGYIEFTIKNEGPRQATIELVLFKPNSNCFGQGGNPIFNSGSSFEDAKNHDPKLVENVWAWLKTCNGQRYADKAKEAQAKKLQPNIGAAVQATDVPVPQDIITNPYVNFLPESSFRNVVDNTGVFQQTPQQVADDTGVITVKNQEQNKLYPGANDDAGAAVGEKDGGGTTGRYKNPYTHLGRAFATVPAQGKRTIRIPLPKMRYNPSEDSHYSKLQDDYTVVSKASDDHVVYPTIMNPQSIMIAMSLNGARSDFFEDDTSGSSTITRFRGQDFTSACVYVDAVYKETVYPAAMVDCKHDVAFNFGRPMNTNAGVPASGDLYPGVVESLARVVPTAPTQAPGKVATQKNPATGSN